MKSPYIALTKRLEVIHDRYKAERIKQKNDQLELEFQLVRSQNQKLIIAIILLIAGIISGVVFVWQQRKSLVEKRVRKWLMEKNSLRYFIATKYNIDLKKVEKQLKER